MDHRLDADIGLCATNVVILYASPQHRIIFHRPSLGFRVLSAQLSCLKRLVVSAIPAHVLLFIEADLGKIKFTLLTAAHRSKRSDQAQGTSGQKYLVA